MQQKWMATIITFDLVAYAAWIQNYLDPGWSKKTQIKEGKF